MNTNQPFFARTAFWWVSAAVWGLVWLLVFTPEPMRFWILSPYLVFLLGLVFEEGVRMLLLQLHTRRLALKDKQP